MNKSQNDKSYLKLQELLKTSVYNLKYSITPITIGFIGILFLFLAILLMINTGVFESKVIKTALGYQLLNGYFKNGYFFTNLVTSILAIGLPILTNKAFELNLLQIKNRDYAFLSKIVAGIITITFICFIALSLFIFIPSVTMKSFVLENHIFSFFSKLYLQLLILYFVLNVIYEITENQFSVAFLSVIYFIALVNNQNYFEITPLMKLLQIILPVIMLDGITPKLLFGEMYLVIYIVILILGLRYIYLNKDIKI